MITDKKEKPKHLGRGLASLLSPITPAELDLKPIPAEPVIIANFPPDKELSGAFREINVDLISPNPYQPRMVWNEQELAELAESIKVSGIIQPIIVRARGERFEIIAGERRFRAAQIASLKTVPSLVRAATDEQLLELALVENIHRTNLNPIERAQAYQNYISTFSLTQSEAASRLGEDRSVVANYLRLLDLPEEIKQMLIDGQLTMGHARAILALPTDELKRKLANRAMAGRLSVREVERLVRKYLTASGAAKPRIQTKPTHIADLETRLSSHLGTKVTIDSRKNGQRGKINIEFYSLDEFDRIIEKMGILFVEQI
jgi:ParB family chromosome partitioning protein